MKTEGAGRLALLAHKQSMTRLKPATGSSKVDEAAVRAGQRDSGKRINGKHN